MITRCLSPIAVVAALSCPAGAAPEAPLTVLVRVADGRATIDAQGAVVIDREAAAHIQIDVGGPASTTIGVALHGVPASFRRLGPRSFVLRLTTDASTPRHGTLIIGGAGGHQVTRDVIVRGTPAPPHRPWELGVFGGYRETSFGRPTSLGEPAPGASLQAGALTGVRAGWSRAWLGVELELGLDVLANARGTDTTSVLAYRGLVAARHDDGAASLRLAGGFGAQSVITPGGGTERDTKLALTWGFTGGYRRGSLLFRLDLRHDLLPADTGLAHGANVMLGVSALLGCR